MGAFLTVLKVLGGLAGSGALSSLTAAANSVAAALGSAAKLVGAYVAGGNAAKAADKSQAEGAYNEAATSVVQAVDGAPADRGALIDRLHKGPGL